MASLTQRDYLAFNEASDRLRIKDPKWLIDMVGFESGYDPKAKNPLSSARGIIQWIDRTAQGMGYKNSLDLVTQHPTLQDQLKTPLIEYLKGYAPFDSEQSLYMAVFLPIARKYSADTSFRTVYKNRYPRDWEKRYARFKKGNPGILKIQDYINHVKKKPIIRGLMKGGMIIVPLAILYFLYRRFK